MAPKKKEQQKMSLGDFLSDQAGFGGGSWADEVEETYVAVGTQPLPPSDRGRSSGTSMWQDRGYSVRETAPQVLPDKPPYTAHLGNLSYDVTEEAVGEFFDGCDVASVRLIEDRETQRPKGFGYVEFGTLDGLKKALSLDGESFGGRSVRIKIADPPRGGDSGRGDSIRELGDWSRKGPLPDLPGQNRRQPSDFGERRPPRDNAFGEGRPPREMTWERHGPLAPVAAQEGSDSRDGSRPRPAPEGLGERGESYRGNRHQSPAAWGEGRQEGSRPPRRDFSDRPERPERPERVATAADQDMKWRERMRPDAAKPTSPDGSAPPSPALSNAAPAPGGRPRLNLAKRTVSEAAPTSPSVGSDSKASPFGAARPIDTAAREKEIEVKRQQAVQEKREADEKAKEDRRLAKEAAVKAEAAAEAKAEAEAEAKAEAAKAEVQEAPKEEEAAPAEKEEEEKKLPVRSREPREPKDTVESQKSRASAASSWRSASGEQRAPRGGHRGGRGGRGDGPPRGPRNDPRPARANGSAASQPTSPDAGDAEAAPVEDDGWTTVPNKKGRGGRA